MTITVHQCPDAGSIVIDSPQNLPTPVETLRGLSCCEVFGALAAALRRHVVIGEPHPLRGHYDEPPPRNEVAESRVWVALLDCDALPCRVRSTKSGQVWVAELLAVHWLPDGWLCEFEIAGAY